MIAKGSCQLRIDARRAAKSSSEPKKASRNEPGKWTRGEADMPPLLAGRMTAAWAIFARNGDPNGGKTIIWPKHNSATRPTMLWDESPAGPRFENDMREE
jgi:carboxylesterase type B